MPGLAILAWLTFAKFVEHEAIGNRPLLSLGILLVLMGVQLVTIGLIAEMQARTYHESQQKSTYVIREILSTPELADVMIGGSKNLIAK